MNKIQIIGPKKPKFKTGRSEKSNQTTKHDITEVPASGKCGEEEKEKGNERERLDGGGHGDCQSSLDLDVPDFSQRVTWQETVIVSLGNSAARF